ncbi:hypothetical protein AC249_AIPGENE6730 [Paramuricea clavata]|uniref:Uncharacterized protein n=1 Tax=Paramuricea clavata TaxID=317549 RepID=A0A7D9I211_PARCT|nr:hypothetical protein AC249_AIPGENE6730 [Paramuricea clavata]
MKQWQIIGDEYPVENAHSIIRSQTLDSDTAETLSSKVKAIFQSKEKQKNFRSSFTPSMKFSFSTKQLQFLKSKAAVTLTSVFESIVHHLMNTQFVEKLNKKKKGTEVKMPQIFGERKLSDCVLPLGYHGRHQPNEDCKCDMPSCTTSKEETWKMFPGCWHSFHESCIKDGSCPLCSKTLSEKAKELGTNDEIIADVTSLNNKISNLCPTLPKNDHRFLPLQPPPPKISKPQNPVTPPSRVTLPSKAPSASYGRDQLLPATPPLRESTHSNTEWLLPQSISQSNLSYNTSGSNACTIISVLGALNLSRKSYFPTSVQEINEAAAYFKQIMIKGNRLYQTLNIESSTPNLHVVDVSLTKLPALTMTIKEDTGFFTEDDMVQKLESIRQENPVMVGVLIIAPDKSMVIYMDQKKIGLMDSHSHGQHGGLIVTCFSSNVKDFVTYVSKMAKQYWNTSLAGANFTILEPYI